MYAKKMRLALGILIGFFVAICSADTKKVTLGKYTWTYYDYGDGTCYIESVSPKLSGKVDLPGTLGGSIIDYYSYSEIDLSGCTSIVFGEGVGGCYLISLPNLISVEFPESMMMIYDSTRGGEMQFRKLEKVVFHGFPEGVNWGGDGWGGPALLPFLMWADSIYYSSEYADEWKKLLRNFGYGGTHGVYKASQKAMMTAMVAAAPQYATDETPDFGPFVVGITAEQTMATVAGKTMTGVPAGLTWNQASGTLSGTATKAGTYTVKVGGESMTVRVDPNSEYVETVRVSFDANGGGDVSAVEVPKAAAIGELPTTTRTGYQFDGWYTKKSGGTKVTTDTKVTADVTYYAHWIAPKAGSCPSAAVALTLSSKRQTVSTTLITPYDDGESYYESDGAYFYKFTLKRGEGFSMCIPYDSRYWFGSEYFTPGLYVGCSEEDADAPEVMYREGGGGSSGTYYVDPAAWESCNASSATYEVYVSGSLGEKFTISYKLFSGYANVVFDCNGGMMTYGDDDYCEELELLLERGSTVDAALKDRFGVLAPSYSRYGSLENWKPTRSQYAFAGWFTEETGGTKVTGKTIVPDADEGVTYYAHWTYDGSAYVGVVVSSECEGMGTVTGGNKSFKSGAKVALKATAKKGYVFTGWYLDDAIETIASTCVSQSPSYTYVATGEEDTTIYAKFIATEDDWVLVDCEAEEEYAKGETMTPIEIAVDSGSLATVKVTGLPTGMKFTAKALSVKATKTTDAAEYAANTIYGKPTKSGVYTATVTATTAGKAKATKTLKFIVRGEGECIVDADVVLTDAIGTIASTEDVPGK